MSVPESLNNTNEKYREVLLGHIPQIMNHIKVLTVDNSNKIENTKKTLENFQNALKTASTQRIVNRYTGEIETSDADDYLFYISQEKQRLQALQSYSGYLSNLTQVLNDIFRIHLKVNETQEAINWQQSAAYASINRYDNDDSDQEVNYESLLHDYMQKLNTLCAKALADKEIYSLITMFIAQENKRKTQSSKNASGRTYTSD